jgi:hypothetical protein
MISRCFQCQKKLCGEPSNLINNVLEIINTPVCRQSYFVEYWCITLLNLAAASQQPDKLLCHLGRVETIMAQIYSGVLDQIARFFIFLSDVPEGEGAFNNNNSTLLVNNEHNNTQNETFTIPCFVVGWLL